MTKEALQEILHILELDYEAEPTLVYVFYAMPDGRVNNFSISVRRGSDMSRQQLTKLMHKEYPATREGDIIAVEKPGDWKPMVEWLDTTEVCRLLHISIRTLRHWTRRGLFETSVIDRHIYYNRANINKVIAARAVTENGRIDSSCLYEKKTPTGYQRTDMP